MSSTGEFDVLVVGGGPAGMAAAARAAQSGVRVGVVDDNLALGGQIWRGAEQDAHALERSHWSEVLKRAGVRLLCGLRVTDQPAPGILVVEGTEEHRELKYHKLILATGARERFLPFPGWTLPNVMGAGGLQAMVKSGLPIEGKRVIIAGSGPLLLAVAKYMRAHGAKVPLVAEQASDGALFRFAAGLVRHPGKLLQTVQFGTSLLGIRRPTSCW